MTEYTDKEMMVLAQIAEFQEYWKRVYRAYMRFVFGK